MNCLKINFPCNHPCNFPNNDRLERFSVPGNEYRIVIVKRYVHCAWVILMKEMDFYNIGYMGLPRIASKTKKVHI